MRKAEYIRRAKARAARAAAEAETNATVLRALNRMMLALELEKVEMLIRLDREKKRVRRR